VNQIKQDLILNKNLDKKAFLPNYGSHFIGVTVIIVNRFLDKVLVVIRNDKKNNNQFKLVYGQLQHNETI